MMTLRKSAERGHANHGWLDSYHSFSFNRYYDPAHMQYSVLRVINEDVIAPAAGFGMHPHRDMEIITYMLSGELRHTDDIGNTAVIRAGDVQRMSAGTGVMHSEVNASDSAPVHLLQIWLLPERKGIAPGYEDMHFPKADKRNQWRLIASRQHRPDSLLVHQDVALQATVLEPGNRLDYALGDGRSAYLQVARGEIVLNGERLQAGDAARLDVPQRLALTAVAEAELLLFDLPAV